MKITIIETSGMTCKVCGVYVPFAQYGWICPCCFPREIEVLHAMRLTSHDLFKIAKFISDNFENSKKG